MAHMASAQAVESTDCAPDNVKIIVVPYAIPVFFKDPTYATVYATLATYGRGIFCQRAEDDKDTWCFFGVSDPNRGIVPPGKYFYFLDGFFLE